MGGKAREVGDFLQELYARLDELGVGILKCIPWCHTNCSHSVKEETPTEGTRWSVLLLRLEGPKPVLRCLQRGQIPIRIRQSGGPPVCLSFVPHNDNDRHR